MTDAEQQAQLAAMVAAAPERTPEQEACVYMRYEDWFSPYAIGGDEDDADPDGHMADWESARVYGGGHP